MRSKNHLDVTRHQPDAPPHIFLDTPASVLRGLPRRLVADLSEAQLARLRLRRAWALHCRDAGALPVLYAGGGS